MKLRPEASSLLRSLPVAASNSVFPAIPAVAAKQVSKMHSVSLVDASKMLSILDHLIVVVLASDALEKQSISTLLIIPRRGEEGGGELTAKRSSPSYF